ncbi:RNA-dependent RNA polymerase, eukaryotic-type [Moelleriella libera RCEF 2490]|uniref:RNA-dependent RNA polymerase n=1 Tax=Moelleriella libera RCEF 2490 TaxID=1081109 RepID=A0A167YV62_9HYPO|nr:RNA-dependent RNA polymerase, eukaryotic-type [Moelleriella libera RCEF 2490]
MPKRQSNNGLPGPKRAKNTSSEISRRILSYFLPLSSSSTMTTTASSPESPPTFSFSGDKAISNDSESVVSDGVSDYITCSDSPTDSEPECFETVAGPPEAFERRLDQVFPRFSNGSFNDAPLAVIWEITRIASHCEVKLADLNIQYNKSDNWSNQSLLRQRIAQLPAFRYKHLPSPTKQSAWDLAIKETQSQDQFFRLRGELVLSPNKSGALFSLKLNGLEIDKGHRLLRRFGSDRFLELLMPSLSSINDLYTGNNVSECLVRWLTNRKHYFLGRQWAAFYCQSQTTKKSQKSADPRQKVIQRQRIFFFACDGDRFEPCLDGLLPLVEDARHPGQRVKVSLSKLLDWTIGDLGTTNQQMPKLFSRVKLSLTSTWPTVVLERNQIHHLAQDVGVASPMNDGIGQISKSLANKVAQALGLTDVPSAYQARLGSAKGLWIIHHNPDFGDGDWIVTYPSQRKWNCDDADIHHRTFEVKSWSKEAKSADLNRQFIPVLEARSKDSNLLRSTLSTHLRNCVEGDLEAQRDAMNHSLDLRLWLRQAGTFEVDKQTNRVPFLGSLPRSDESVIGMLVDSGFEPKSCGFLQEKCRRLAAARADELEARLNIRIPQSTYLFMVVDFSSTLKENEVHLSFSTKFQVDGFSDTLLEDIDILVARSPAHLPTDMQRVRVVSRPQLRHLKDCVVFSVQGKSSLADKLSGGDYDGDRAWICWDQDIVRNFENAPPDETGNGDISAFVHKINRPMSQIRDQEAGRREDVCAQFLYEAFSFNMQDSLLGLCTHYKEQYCYLHGRVTGADIIKMSKLLGMLVDQPKQGFEFTKSDWHKMRDKLGLPRSLASDGVLLRKAPHILDFLREVLQTTVHEAFVAFKKSLGGQEAQHYDSDLTKMINYFDKSYSSRAEWKQLRDQLRADIDALTKQWDNTYNPKKPDDYVSKVGEIYDLWLNIKPARAVRSSDLVCSLLPSWRNDPHTSDWALLKASFVFQRLCRSKPQLPWLLAGYQLCLLKRFASEPAGGSCGWLPVQLDIWSALRPDRKFIKAQQARRVGTSYAGDDDWVSEWDEDVDGAETTDAA